MDKQNESLQEGDWIKERETGRLGIIYRIDLDEKDCSIVFATGVGLRYLKDLELAQPDIREEDLLALQHLAVESNDKVWFDELGERLRVSIKQV